MLDIHVTVMGVEADGVKFAPLLFGKVSSAHRPMTIQPQLSLVRQTLAATDAARRGESRDDIQKRLVHTSGKTTDIYIKEVIADVSEIPMVLPWL